jgi:hypothetical protein
MSKKMSGGEPSEARLLKGERAPPLLSEELIAKLQGAVNAAQRKRTLQPSMQETKETALTVKDQ